MDIHQMEYFIAVCDYHGITPAAEALFLTPQALSKSIRKLEEELDAPLFIRDKSSLSLTPFGEKALTEMRQLTEEYHAVKQRLHQISVQENGCLRLACAFGVPNALPLDDLRAKLAPHGITLDLMELPDLAAEEMIRQNAVDLGFTIGLPREPELFQTTLLRRYQLCAVLNKHHPLTQKEVLTMEDLRGQPIITKSPYFRSHALLEQTAAAQGITLTYALESPDELRFVNLLDSNAGIGVGVTCMDTPRLRVSDSSVIRPFAEPLPWDVYLTIRKGHYLSASAQKVVEYIKGWRDPSLYE